MELKKGQKVKLGVTFRNFPADDIYIYSGWQQNDMLLVYHLRDVNKGNINLGDLFLVHPSNVFPVIETPSLIDWDKLKIDVIKAETEWFSTHLEIFDWFKQQVESQVNK